jgi:hypothetical protein
MNLILLRWSVLNLAVFASGIGVVWLYDDMPMYKSGSGTTAGAIVMALASVSQAACVLAFIFKGWF